MQICRLKLTFSAPNLPTWYYYWVYGQGTLSSPSFVSPVLYMLQFRPNYFAGQMLGCDCQTSMMSVRSKN